MFSLLNIKFIKYDKVTQIKYNIKGFYIFKISFVLKRHELCCFIHFYFTYNEIIILEQKETISLPLIGICDIIT